MTIDKTFLAEAMLIAEMRESSPPNAFAVLPPLKGVDPIVALMPFRFHAPELTWSIDRENGCYHCTVSTKYEFSRDVAGV